MSKTIFASLLLVFALVENSVADTNYSRHILSVADNNIISYRFMLDDSIGLSYGYYQSKHERTNSTGQSTADYREEVIGIRLNFNPENALRSFTELTFTRIKLDYEGSTQEDYFHKQNVLWVGMEYLLSEHFSIEGALGLGKSDTTYETSTGSGKFGPATKLAVSYLF